jgi:hypothetical protein
LKTLGDCFPDEKDQSLLYGLAGKAAGDATGLLQGDRISEQREEAGKVGIIPTCTLEFSSQRAF